MNNKKGFTLVELIGTILVLGVVVSIIIISIVSIINSSKQKTYLLTENNILKTALTYVKENTDKKVYTTKIDNPQVEYQCLKIQD